MRNAVRRINDGFQSDALRKCTAYIGFEQSNTAFFASSVNNCQYRYGNFRFHSLMCKANKKWALSSPFTIIACKYTVFLSILKKERRIWQVKTSLKTVAVGLTVCTSCLCAVLSAKRIHCLQKYFDLYSDVKKKTATSKKCCEIRENRHLYVIARH